MNRTLQLIAAEDHVDNGDPNVLQLANDADPLAIEVCLDDVDRIDLDFPKFTDGRAYSQARLLRARYRFNGEIRATGQVLVDMLPLLARCGFDAAELRADQSLEAAERALSFFPDGHYQGDLGEPLPCFRRRAEAPA